MGAMACQITSLAIIYSTVYSDADQRKHQSSASLAFVRGIHRGPVNAPHKWLVPRKMFPFDDVIMRRGLCNRLYLDISSSSNQNLLPYTSIANIATEADFPLSWDGYTWRHLCPSHFDVLCVIVDQCVGARHGTGDPVKIWKTLQWRHISIMAS